MDDLTEEQREELLAGYMNPQLAMVLSVDDGDYVIFPHGIQKFAEKHKAEAVSVDPDGRIHVLREGLQNDKLKWVCLVLDYDEQKENSKDG